MTGPAVLLTRANRNEVDAAALAVHGIAAVVEPYLEISQVENPAGAAAMFAALAEAPERGSVWLALTSPNALEHWLDQLPPRVLPELLGTSPWLRAAAVGEETAAQLERLGATEVLLAPERSSASLAAALLERGASRVVIPAGTIAMRDLPEALAAAGCAVVSEIVYRTETVTAAPPSALARDPRVAAAVLRSPSAARALFQHAGSAAYPVVCAGQSTARQARELGLSVLAVATEPSAAGLAEAVVRGLAELPTSAPELESRAHHD